jgi:opine dehydrogenase
VKVAVLGAGAGGASAVVELSQSGHDVRLWNRSAPTLETLRAAGGVAYSGVFGDGFAAVDVITTDLVQAARGVDALLVCLPTLALGRLAAELAQARIQIPAVLNPGHTGGALEFAHVFRQLGRTPPPTVEFSTLTYVARKPDPERVVTTGRARSVRAAALPGGKVALDLARELYSAATPAPNVLATSLSNVNMVLHPPGAILGSAWIESTHGDFTFYVQGLTDGVARVMEQLDRERRGVAKELGQELPSLFHEMRAIGTIEAAADEGAGLACAVRSGTANRHIRAPDTLTHRYFHEDLWYGLKPFLAFAAIAGVDVPIAQALWKLGVAILGPHAPARGRSAAEMGIERLTVPSLIRMVTEGP